MSDVITDPKMRTFVNSKVSTEFGLSISQVANKVKGYGRFNSWLGGDVSKIEQVLQIVKDNGISPAFFASYERTEGHTSPWGWLNHTKQQGDYFQDANSVSNVVKNQSNNMSGNPSWEDYGNYVDFVPQSVKTAGNAHFSSLPKGTIGRALIPLTAAAAWEVYYPNGLLKEYNLIQDYGAPINIMINTIEEWGGVIGNNDGGGTDPDPVDPDPEEPEIPIEPEEPEVPDVPVDEIFNILLHEKSEDLIGNRFFNIEKLYENMYKLKPTKLFYDTVIIEGIEDYPYDDEEDPIDPGVPDPVEPDPEDPVEPEPSGKPAWPTRAGLRITSRYGYRGDIGVPGASHYHWAIDIGGGGTTHPIFATQDGIVRRNNWSDGGGWGITIEHTGDTYWSRYIHLNSQSPIAIGTQVKKGQEIGTMGTTGISSGIHLDFAISVNGQFGTETDTIDPEVYLKG